MSPVRNNVVWLKFVLQHLITLTPSTEYEGVLYGKIFFHYRDFFQKLKTRDRIFWHLTEYTFRFALLNSLFTAIREKSSSNVLGPVYTALAYKRLSNPELIPLRLETLIKKASKCYAQLQGAYPQAFDLDLDDDIVLAKLLLLPEAVSTSLAFKKTLSILQKMAPAYNRFGWIYSLFFHLNLQLGSN